MTDPSNASPLQELYAVADDLDDLTMWEPSDPDDEPPSDVLADDDWVRRRLLALRFTTEEITKYSDAADAEIERILDSLEAIIGREADPDLDQESTGLRRSQSVLTAQLVAYHRAKIRDAEARGLKKLPTTIKTLQGRLRSGAGTHRVQITDKSALIEWLVANGHNDVITRIPAHIEVDLRKLKGLVHLDGDGSPVGVVSEDGDLCPGVRVIPAERWHKVDIDS